MTIAELRDLLSKFDDQRPVVLESGTDIVAHDDGDFIYVGSPEGLRQTFEQAELDFGLDLLREKENDIW